MKNNKYKIGLLSTYMMLLGCSQPTEDSQTTIVPTAFSIADAKNNLNFAKKQYLKLLNHVKNREHLHSKPACIENSKMICVPRSQEHNAIFMEESKKWTNGFLPGALWKLLSSREYINTWNEGEEQALFDFAKHYQSALFSEAKRGSTHDLGFILYDSFGEALNYDKLDADNRQAYIQALDTGRAMLATRYRDEQGLIRSWDWKPKVRLNTIENGEKVLDQYTLSNPWTYPVIVDNMMNLEFLFDSDNARYHEIAFNHAKHTSLNHYFYDESDKDKQYPLSYHVFDYGSNKPGNWQGVGNISAWARGQGWSLYGYVTVVEAMEKANVDLANYPDFNAHLDRLFGSIEYLLQDNVVPYWDYFATRKNAVDYAENISNDTTVFSGILTLCDKLIEDNLKPYVGYRPMQLDAAMLSDESLKRLEGKLNWYGEPVIQGDKLVPCGSKGYADSHVKIPRDTSAAAIYAAALYRYAEFASDNIIKQRAINLADKIMAELTTTYRTDKNKTRPDSYDFGFVLAEATGDMGKGSELDTSIVYADFYFIEANIRKIKLENNQ